MQGGREEEERVVDGGRAELETKRREDLESFPRIWSRSREED